MTGCEDPDIQRLEWAPHHVSVRYVDGEFQPDGNTELLDAPWDESNSYWCRTCDEKLIGERNVLEHMGVSVLPPDTVPDEIELVLDVEHDNGITWLDCWGHVNDDHQAVVVEELEGVVRCESCTETKPSYRPPASRGSYPMCRDCLGEYDWVKAVQ